MAKKLDTSFLKNLDLSRNNTQNPGTEAGQGEESVKPVEDKAAAEAPAPAPEPKSEEAPKAAAADETKTEQKQEARPDRGGEEKPVRKTSKPDKAKSPKTEAKSVERFNLVVESDKRRTAGFHIYPEYEKAIETLTLLGRHRNKGRALEFLVDFYLSHIPDARRKEFLEAMKGQEDDWS